MTVQKYPYNPLSWQSSPHDFTGVNNLGVYCNDDTQRYVPGTRFTTWDGRVFKYSKSVADLLSGFGAFNDSTPINIAVTGATIVVGDKTTVLVFASTDGYAADGVCADKELVGGYWVTGHGVSTVQTRLIVDTEGVGVSGVGGNIKLHLDGPVSNALTTPFTEVVLNPYRYLIRTPADVYHAVMGVPAANRTSTYWGWIQTWGPCWVCPGGGDASPGDSVGDRMAYFVGDGSVNFGTSMSGGSLASHVQYQPAGFCIDETASGTSAMPLIMLQISI